MTEAGAALYAGSEPQEQSRPRYDVAATVEPADGRVRGELTAVLPVGDEEKATFRLFAGLPDLEASPELGDVEVDGEPAEATRTPRSSRCAARGARRRRHRPHAVRLLPA